MLFSIVHAILPTIVLVGALFFFREKLLFLKEDTLFSGVKAIPDFNVSFSKEELLEAPVLKRAFAIVGGFIFSGFIFLPLMLITALVGDPTGSGWFILLGVLYGTRVGYEAVVIVLREEST